MTQRDEFVRVALTWVGVPWRNTGCRRDGVNCLGLLVGIAKECGFLTDIAGKEAEANFVRPHIRGFMLGRAKEDLDTIIRRDILPGDLLLFRFNGYPAHIAIVVQLKPLMIVHSDSSELPKIVRCSTMPNGWIPTMAFRIRELDDD